VDGDEVLVFQYKGYAYDPEWFFGRTPLQLSSEFDDAETIIIVEGISSFHDLAYETLGEILHVDRDMYPRSNSCINFTFMFLYF